MATEIERKFLVTGKSFLDGRQGSALKQGYISSSGEMTVRVRVVGDSAYLTLKAVVAGISRAEYEYPIPLEDAVELLANYCSDACIKKTRYHVQVGEHWWEVDVFHGDNAGLVVAEIELSAENEEFEYPPWIGPEVSHDRRYYSAYLSQHPWREWGV